MGIDFRPGFTALTSCIAASAMLYSPAQTMPKPADSKAPQKCVKVFLQRYLVSVSPEDTKTTRYNAALVHLGNDASQQAIVYLTGDGWCGSGGCTMLILKRDGVQWRLLTKTTITRPPVRILNETSYGWRSIGVWVQGGGIQPGYEAELSYDGKTYPSNPSMPPARPLKTKVTGEIVIPASPSGEPLYP